MTTVVLKGESSRLSTKFDWVRGVYYKVSNLLRSKNSVCLPVIRIRIDWKKYKISITKHLLAEYRCASQMSHMRHIVLDVTQK